MQARRISFVGSSGSGKTTLASALADELALPRVELDAINWQPGWRGLHIHDPQEFARRVDATIASDAWVIDGNYSAVRARIWARATHLIWLDYERLVIMARVLRRSIARSLSGAELWPGTGNREEWSRWFTDPDHPIRWAWRTFKVRRVMYEAQLSDSNNAHLQVHRLRSTREAIGVAARLV